MTTPKKPLGPHNVPASWMSDSVPRATQDAFWQYVNDFENAPTATEFQRLGDAGVELPAPEALSDEQLTEKLWEVVFALAELSVFLSSTDHLSDRELYALLWSDVLRIEDEIIPGAFTHIDLVGDGSEQATHLDLMYYADEKTRRSWIDEFPDDELPPHVDPPYDRDRLLPNPFKAQDEAEERTPDAKVGPTR